MTGYGMDVLRARLADLLADLWEDVDVALPYSEGELLSRVRERGTVDIGYRARDVRVRGRVTPSLASELRAARFRSQWEACMNDETRFSVDCAQHGLGWQCAVFVGTAEDGVEHLVLRQSRRACSPGSGPLGADAAGRGVIPLPARAGGPQVDPARVCDQ